MDGIIARNNVVTGEKKIESLIDRQTTNSGVLDEATPHGDA